MVCLKNGKILGIHHNIAFARNELGYANMCTNCSTVKEVHLVNTTTESYKAGWEEDPCLLAPLDGRETIDAGNGNFISYLNKTGAQITKKTKMDDYTRGILVEEGLI